MTLDRANCFMLGIFIGAVMVMAIFWIAGVR